MKKFLFIIILTATTLLLHAQQYEFSHLRNTDGLSSNQIETIYKDSRGFLWIGTNVGLNRYDGTNIKIYQNIRDDRTSLPFDAIRNIKEDFDGNLLIQGPTYAIYDWRQEAFISNIDSVLVSMGLPAGATALEIDKNKNLYTTYEGKGLYVYNPNTKEITVYPQSGGEASLDPSIITDIQVHTHYIWLLHLNGTLERIDTRTKNVDIRNTFFKENTKNATIDKHIFVDSDNMVWIYPGLADKGTAFFNPSQKRWTFLDSESNIKLSSSFVRIVRQDRSGLMWIGTDHGGLNIYNKKTNSTVVLKNDKNDTKSVGQNTIISLFCDPNGSVWVGTYKNGLSYYHPDMFKFKTPGLIKTLGSRQEIIDCNSFFKDHAGNLWIGTNGQGLIRHNAETRETTHFRNNPNDNTSISSDIITSIVEDHQRTMWIGTFLGGLDAVQGNRFVRYQMDDNNPNSLSSKSVYGLAEDNANKLWIGTLGGGLNVLDAQRKNFTRYYTHNSPLVSNFVVSISSDADKNIYISTDRGVNFVDKNRKTIEGVFVDNSEFDSLLTIVTNYQIADSRGLVWIASNKGITVYNPTTDRFMLITTTDGLPSYEVVSLVEDNDGNIWAGTRNGLACIYCSYKNGELSYSIASFNENDGLTGAICNLNAAYKDNNGILYFGTTTGYSAFDPRKIHFINEQHFPRFTELLITNQIIDPNTKYNGRTILKKTIGDVDEIRLRYNETNFTIRFSSLNLIRPEKNRYRYKLEGLDNQWTEINDGIGTASYSNLNPGTYRLIVYSGNDDNTWSETPITMKITVAPPFWLSWWAYLIYLFIILGMIKMFLDFKLQKQKREYEQAQQILEVNKRHELDELKLKFFTNISHEFKTPISLIISPLEKLMKSDEYTKQKSTLDMIHRNAQSLLKMVDEILDFRKFDLNKMALNRSGGNIVEFTKEICQSFSTLANQKSIKLTFTTNLQELQMLFDAEKMNKIIVNLISNAFKYTEEGSIDVSLSTSEQMQSGKQGTRNLILKVSDTGIGIEPKFRERIFERFFRIEHNDKNRQPGTGIGLHLVSEYVKLHGGEIHVESASGNGSVFTVALPIDNPLFEEVTSSKVIRLNSTEEATQTSDEKTAKSTIQRANQPLLLIIDDNEDFCEFITDLFSDDYRIVAANDGAEGCSIVLDQLPDIILCDVMMPKMDGYEFCRVMKSDIRTSHIPIILLTAKSSEENKYSGIEAGADDYISKPFNIDILKLKIAKIIEKQKRMQARFKKKIDVAPGDIEITSMDEKFVQKAIAIVEENIGNADFLVEDLCKEMGMSRVYFYKKILALTDKTPSEFIRLIRLKRAAELLEKSQKFVNEIAYEVGFNDPKYFRKYFKEEFGVTPNEYKKGGTK